LFRTLRELNWLKPKNKKRGRVGLFRDM